MESLGLAAPRRKTRYDIDPRNNAWANDENKFGQKMLEKFGWAKGKGLGAQEDGNTDNIKVKVKNDKLGVGSDNDYADTWLDHQDDFNSILASLNTSHSAPASGAASPKERSEEPVQSMEERSKSSKARVHYKKFTRGKDLKRANAEDIDALFGVRKNFEKRSKRSKKDAFVASETASRSAPVTPASGRSPDNRDNDQDREYDTDGNLRTITNVLSVAEYFAQKMAALKAKSGGVSAPVETFCKNAAAAASETKDKASREDEDEDAPEAHAQEKYVTSAISLQEYFKKKMEEKNKAGKMENNNDESIYGQTEKKIGKKKKKQKMSLDLTNPTENCDVEAPKKKNRKKKKKLKMPNDERMPEDNVMAPIESVAKKKKRKRDMANIGDKDDSGVVDDSPTDSEAKLSKAKRKKRKEKLDQSTNEEEYAKEDGQKKKKKKLD